VDARRVLTVLIAAAALAAACFSDLPAATPAVCDGGVCPPDASAKCPPDPATNGMSCESVVTSLGSQGALRPGCFPQQLPQLAAYACFLSPDAGPPSCDCGGNDCPETTCLAGSECPPAATETGATCPKPAPLAFMTGCTGCGCSVCMAACDAIGPVFAVTIPTPSDGGAGAPAPLVVVNVTDLLSSGGRVGGAYARLRGVGAAFLTLFDDTGHAVGAKELVLNPAYSDVLVEPTAPSQITSIAVLAPGPEPGSMPAVTVVQVDCIVPIVLPP
jgi:hypothetical protein